MTDLNLWLEDFWGAILSEDPVVIRKVWAPLSDEERAAVRAHLVRMMSESGWAEVQRAAAQVALQTLDQDDQKG